MSLEGYTFGEGIPRFVYPRTKSETDSTCSEMMKSQARQLSTFVDADELKGDALAFAKTAAEKRQFRPHRAEHQQQ